MRTSKSEGQVFDSPIIRICPHESIRIMYKKCLLLFVILFYGCKRQEMGLSNSVVINSIDSICAICEPIRNGSFENIELDEYYLLDERNPRNKQWIWGDSIAKYCNTDELTELATKHNSLALRFVAFKLLLKKDSHEAVKILIDNIDSNDSINASHLDESFPELLSGLRVMLVQGDRKLYNISVADSIAVAEAILKSKNRSKLYHYSSKELKIIIGGDGSADKNKKSEGKVSDSSIIISVPMIHV